MQRILSLGIIAVLFIVAGLNHFRGPVVYPTYVPSSLPFAPLLNWVCVGTEIAGGLGLLIPSSRRQAGLGLMVLLIAVFPTWMQMAFYHGVPDASLPQWSLGMRLLVQMSLIAWVFWTSQFNTVKVNPRRLYLRPGLD